MSQLLAISSDFSAVAVGAHVCVFHATKTRFFRQHTTDIVALLRSPLEDDQSLFSVSQDGNILRWNPYSFEVTNRYYLADVKALTILAAAGQRGPALCVVAHVCEAGRERVLIAPLCKDGELESQSRQIISAGKQQPWVCKQCNRWNKPQVLTCGKMKCTAENPVLFSSFEGFSATCGYVAVTQNKVVAVYDTTKGGKDRHWVFRCQQEVSAVRLDPSSPRVAVGLENGKIFLHSWNPADPGWRSKDDQCPRKHWHHTAVRHLQWSDDGTFLLSVGDDAVILLWNPASGVQGTMPRLTKIVGFTLDTRSMRLLVFAEPNQLHVVDALAKRVVETRTDLSSQQASSYNGFALRKDATVALFGSTHTLEFRNVVLGLTVSTHSVLPLNFISQVNKEPPISMTVECLCFSPDSEWMVTFSQADVTMGEDIFMNSLRFWSFQNETYTLTTLSHAPHKGAVTDMAYHSSLHLVVTAGSDRKVKLWSLTEATSAKFWVCQRTLSKPTLFPRCVCFSTDDAGSLVLVGHSQLVSLWRSDDLQSPGDNAELTQYMDDGELKSVCMLSDARTVVAHSDKYLFVWDLIHHVLTWCAELTVSCIVPLPNRGKAAGFALLAANRILEFTAESNAPYFVSPPKLTTADACRLLVLQDQQHGNQPRYAIMDTAGEVDVYTPPQGTSSACALRDGVAARPLPVDEEPEPPLPRPSTMPVAAPVAPILPAPIVAQPCNFLFTGDTHAVPPTRTMFDSFMDQFLIKTGA